MQFNNILLPPFVIAGLYKHSLVLLDEEMMVSNGRLALSFEQLEVSIEQLALHNGHVDVLEKLGFAEPTIETKPTESKKADYQPKAESKVTVIQPIFPKGPEHIIEPFKPINATPLNPDIKYLGGFGKKISIVLEDHFHPTINDGDLVFLTKLLQACQLSLNDVAIINVASNANANQLWQLMPAEKMIIFEVDPGTLGLPFRMPHFRLQPWADCVFLASPSLEALQNGASEKMVQLKRNLWECLKKMFLS